MPKFSRRNLLRAGRKGETLETANRKRDDDGKPRPAYPHATGWYQHKRKLLATGFFAMIAVPAPFTNIDINRTSTEHCREPASERSHGAQRSETTEAACHTEVILSVTIRVGESEDPYAKFHFQWNAIEPPDFI